MRLMESLVAAAVSGIVVGIAGCENTPPPNTGATSAAAMPAANGAKHACKGQNGCKGQGGCKTDKNGCKGQNACKGQGGCKTG
jgi:hypothetical protein